jgi:hypothetical protein
MTLAQGLLGGCGHLTRGDSLEGHDWGPWSQALPQDFAVSSQLGTQLSQRQGPQRARKHSHAS